MLLLRSWTAPEDTNVIIVFDNTYSMMRPKTIASPAILEAFGRIIDVFLPFPKECVGMILQPAAFCTI